MASAQVAAPPAPPPPPAPVLDPVAVAVPVPELEVAVSLLPPLPPVPRLPAAVAAALALPSVSVAPVSGELLHAARTTMEANARAKVRGRQEIIASDVQHGGHRVNRPRIDATNLTHPGHAGAIAEKSDSGGGHGERGGSLGRPRFES